jgi:hypothetical protein
VQGFLFHLGYQTTDFREWTFRAGAW